MLIVTNEDVHDGTREVSAEVFTPDKQDCLQFNWQGTETVNLEQFVDGIRLSERQFEELIPNTDVSGGENNESESDDDATEQIAH